MAELETNVNDTTEPVETEPTEQDFRKKLEELKAENAKLKASNDKLSKESAEKTRRLRANQTAEQAAAEEAKERAQAQAEELAALRKEIAVTKTSKRVMSFVGDEETANSIAGFLYGSEDPDAVIDAFQKAWTAKEKALRLEYGKIPAPGAGVSDGPSVTLEQLNGMSVRERTMFARAHREEYNKLMGR